MKKKILVILLALALVVMAFAGCGNNAIQDQPDVTEAPAGDATEAPSETEAPTSDVVDDLATVKANGKLVVGVTDFAPMDYQEDGKWVGFDAEMATLFAQKLGVEAEIVEIEWDNKVMELNGGTIDCVWNGMTIDDEVKAAMSCSDPYCNNAQIVIVHAADAGKYQSAEACKELNFAVEAGSAGMKQAQANGFNFTEVKDQATALMEVAAGTCDGAIIDSLMAAAMVGEGTAYADLTYTVKLNSEEYGVGFRTGSNLVAELNAFLKECAANGKLEEIATKYNVQAALIK